MHISINIPERSILFNAYRVAITLPLHTLPISRISFIDARSFYDKLIIPSVNDFLSRILRVRVREKGHKKIPANLHNFLYKNSIIALQIVAYRIP